MSILDSRVKIATLDKSGLLGSVESLPDQIEDAWSQTQNLSFPLDYQKVKNIVVSGMGGSNLGTLVIKNLYKQELAIPLEIYPHYELPGYISEDSLVILSSYSGTTEETLAAAQQAKQLGAKIAVITGGGQLAAMATQNKWPMYLINPKYNPCNQPRMAIGYTIVGQLAMFHKMGFIQFAKEDLANLATNLRQMAKTLGPENLTHNTAKMLAYKAFDKHIILSAAEHLIGATHVFNNQLNENAKTLTSEWHLPEFNHHFLEAISHPQSTKENTIFFLINSSLYHPRVSKRFALTQQIIESKGYEVVLIQATAPTRFEQVFEIIMLGEFCALYLPILYGIDPSAIPNVENFKRLLA